VRIVQEIVLHVLAILVQHAINVMMGFSYTLGSVMLAALRLSILIQEFLIVKTAIQPVILALARLQALVQAANQEI